MTTEILHKGTRVYALTLPEYGHLVPLMEFFSVKKIDQVCILVPLGFSSKVSNILQQNFPHISYTLQEIDVPYVEPGTLGAYHVWSHFESTLAYVSKAKNFLASVPKESCLVVDAVLEYGLDTKFIQRFESVHIFHAILPMLIKNMWKFRVSFSHIFGSFWRLPQKTFKMLKLFVKTNANMSHKIYLRHVHTTFQLPRTVFAPKALAKLVYFPRGTEVLEPVASRVQNISEELKNFLQHHNNIMYISFGTVFPQQEIFSRIISLFSQRNLVISCKPEHVAQLQLCMKEEGSHVFIGSNLPQLAVLEKSSLFITHGGYNSIVEALQRNVPMILFPYMYEQMLNAKVVVKLQQGKIASNKMHDEEIQHLAQSIFS